MKHRPGFALYEAVFAMSIIALIGAIYLISAWGKEFLYYRELNRQRTVGFTDFTICGGPNKARCEEGQTCELTKSHKEAYGQCI